MRSRIAAILITITLGGCGNPSAPLSSAEQARKSLELGLEAWKAGRSAAPLREEKPAVDFVDYQWKAGTKLVGYLVDSDSADSETHTFTVELTTADAKGPRKVQYMVLGLDPIHVFRDEDYNRTLNMDNAPATAKPQGKRR
ncbi:hypothetical protein [Aquisphaera insulae]|uniref:hypothetical protein n=1 Tax=Aquisphaera insulae TaxID=2712864 RepID=UPI0013EB3352|nr:hypothetical protein [Aquisphaera insulae]